VSRITANDFLFIDAASSHAIRKPIKNLSLVERYEILDALDNKVANLIINSSNILTISQYLYFFILVRKALYPHPIRDMATIDYVASVLCDSVSTANAFRTAISGDRVHYYISDMIRKLERISSVTEKFILTVQLANQTLLITGIFPDYLTARVRHKGAPSLSFYEKIGQSQFLSAKDYQLAHDYDLTLIFDFLGSKFPDIRRSLNQLSDQYLMLGDPM